MQAEKLGAMQWSAIRKMAEQRVELKKVKTYPRLSEETIAMNCDVWFDGELVGHAENRGNGGDNFIHSVSSRSHLQPLEQFITSLPCLAREGDEADGFCDLQMSVDLFISMWIGDHEEEREFKRICKKKILMKMTDGNHYTVNWAYTPERAVMLREREGAELVEIINERFI
jgi:hypothetical protein